MPCPAHRYDTLLSACIYIGAIEPSARAPDTNLSLPICVTTTKIVSHASLYLHRPWLRCVRQHHHPHRPPSPCRFVGAAAAVPQCRCTVDSHQCRSEEDARALVLPPGAGPGARATATGRPASCPTLPSPARCGPPLPFILRIYDPMVMEHPSITFLAAAAAAVS